MRLFDGIRNKLVRLGGRLPGVRIASSLAAAVFRLFRLTTARMSRRGKILFYAAAGVVGISFIGGLGVAIWSGYPSFCKSCHHVKPYVRSWASSVHGKEHVTCTDCHFKPGLVPYAMGKVNGLVEVVKYFSGAVPVKLRSEVADVSCLREGCHSVDELKAEAVAAVAAVADDKPNRPKQGEIGFDHEKHLGEPLRGLHFRCATCHSTSLHSEDETVSRRTCFTCHFMPERADETATEREAREKLAKCDTCHELPKEVTTVAEITFDHEKYAASDGECFRCHANVTRGDGAVPKDQCITCHNEGLGHLDKYAETEEVHEIHVTEHQVACFECHDEISHGTTGVAALEAEPSLAFLSGPFFRPHRAAEKLYGGSGGAGVEDVPDPMFVTEVQCAGCHTSLREEGGEGGTEPNASESCVICHEEGYDKLPARWSLAFDGYVSKLEAAREKAASLDRLGPEAKRLLAEAARNIELVREGGAVHNVRYAALCLRRASAGLGEILKPAGLGDAAVALPTYEADAAKCLDVCHLGVETVGGLKYAEEDFPHREHVESRRVKCSQCHSFDDEHHKETFARTRDCSACHHEEETVAGENACKSCHPVQDAVYFGKVAGDPRARPAKMAVARAAETNEKVTCLSCHTGVSEGHSRERVIRLCQECHGGQQARERILEEWQAGITAELGDLEALIRRGKAHLADGRGLSEEDASALRSALVTAEKAAELVREDESFGAHNLEYLYSVLSDAAQEIKAAAGF